MEMSAWATHDELDVANTLRQLAKLVPASDRRAGILRWGLRRKRSGPADEPPPLLPPPPQDREEPPTKLEEEIRKRNNSGGASTSPATPVSSFKTPARVMPPPTKLPSKALGQLHKRVMEMSQMVAASSADNANLKRSLAETRSRFERLKETNSLLRNIRLKIMEMEERERERRRCSDIVTSVGPNYINSLPVGPHHHAHQQLQHNPSWRDAVAPALPQHERGWAAASRMEGGGARRETAVPDLNASAEEAELRQSAMRAAMSAQARRRRIEIQREKSCYSYSLPPSAAASSASLAYKIPPRFR